MVLLCALQSPEVLGRRGKDRGGRRSSSPPRLVQTDQLQVPLIYVLVLAVPGCLSQSFILIFAIALTLLLEREHREQDNPGNRSEMSTRCALTQILPLNTQVTIYI